ncbi:glycosyl hydrolase family 28-related protein [Benzoatithermus flavus]|uniref:Glycosyl hydrolase family 28-related protein n=1 Tax=Benzoatithermus flavus TaxID=3108223 RepID=A0ABU8XQE0_9PROT
MANKQIHELTAAAELNPEDQLVVSIASGNLTRRASIASLPFRQALTGATVRLLAGKLGELVSVKDFGAKGDGSADDSAAFQAALDQHQAVFVPPGTYRLDSEVQAKPRRTLLGAGRDATIIDARGPRAFTFNRNTGPYKVDTTAAEDWNRSALGGMTIKMAQGGVRVIGHEFRARELAFFGGSAPSGIADPDGWCLDLVDANECALREIQAGYGGGASHTLAANGIRFRSTQTGVNYGDSSVSEVSLKLGAAGTCGVLLEGNHPGLINNVLLARIQVNAPQGGTGLTPLAGTVGIWLKTVRRCQLDTVDVEVTETGFKEEGTGVNGNPGTNADIVYLNCQAQNCSTPYDDNNDDGEGRAIRRTMLGTTELFPLKTGVGSTDDTVQAGRGAALLPNDLWLCEPNKGLPAVQLRAYAKGILYIAQDYQEAAGAIRDGNPKNQKPRRGLIIDASANDTTVIQAPRGLTTSTVRRLEIGNGPAHPDGRLHRIELRDPLYLTPRSDAPANATLPGMVCWFDGNAGLPVNTRWRGPGLYVLTSWQGGFEWMPMGGVLGLEPDREENLSFTLSQLHVGRLVRVNSGSDRTVSIPEGIVSAGFPLARLWIMRQGTGRVLFQETGSPAPAWTSTAGAGVLKEIPRQYQIVELWLRWDPTANAGAGGTQIFATHDIMPDGEFQSASRLKWSTASPPSDLDTTDPNFVPPSATNYYTLGSADAGKLFRISRSPAKAKTFIGITNGFVPSVLAGEGAWIKFVNVAGPGARIIPISPMTLVAPDGSGNAYYDLITVGKVVTVHVSGPSASSGANVIYIEE